MSLNLKYSSDDSRCRKSRHWNKCWHVALIQLNSDSIRVISPAVWITKLVWVLLDSIRNPSVLFTWERWPARAQHALNSKRVPYIRTQAQIVCRRFGFVLWFGWNWKLNGTKHGKCLYNLFIIWIKLKKSTNKHRKVKDVLDIVKRSVSSNSSWAWIWISSQ